MYLEKQVAAARLMITAFWVASPAQAHNVECYQMELWYSSTTGDHFFDRRIKWTSNGVDTWSSDVEPLVPDKTGYRRLGHQLTILAQDRHGISPNLPLREVRLYQHEGRSDYFNAIHQTSVRAAEHLNYSYVGLMGFLPSRKLNHVNFDVSRAMVAVRSYQHPRRQGTLGTGEMFTAFSDATYQRARDNNYRHARTEGYAFQTCSDYARWIRTLKGLPFGAISTPTPAPPPTDEPEPRSSTYRVLVECSNTNAQNVQFTIRTCAAAPEHPHRANELTAQVAAFANGLTQSFRVTTRCRGLNHVLEQRDVLPKSQCALCCHVILCDGNCLGLGSGKSKRMSRSKRKYQQAKVDKTAWKHKGMWKLRGKRERKK